VDPTEPSNSPFNVTNCVNFDGNLTIDFKDRPLPTGETTIPIASYACKRGEFAHIHVIAGGKEICDPDLLTAQIQYKPTIVQVLFRLDSCRELPATSASSVSLLVALLFVVAISVVL
jgi:hypothetical protein